MKTYTVEVGNNGDTYWRNSNGKLHREDGPAVEFADGDRSWWINGERHRTDGPAIEDASGYRAWYVDGKRLSEQEFNAQSINEMKLSEVEALLSKKIKIISE